jgi:hypothetical protein
MDFASLMSAQIAKGKPTPKSQAPVETKPSKYIKRADVEAQRQADYAAEQKAIEDARLARVDKKRKFDEDEAEKNRAREDKRKRLAEESRRLKEEEDEREERIRRKRLGLPELPPKEKAIEGGDATPVPENDIPPEELVQKLRDMNEPARLFGETHTGQLRRYRKLAGLDASGKPKAIMYPRIQRVAHSSFANLLLTLLWSCQSGKSRCLYETRLSRRAAAEKPLTVPWFKLATAWSHYIGNWRGERSRKESWVPSSRLSEHVKRDATSMPMMPTCD